MRQRKPDVISDLWYRKEPHAGFSKADKTVLPVISKGPWSYQSINAADQRRDPESMLNWTERIIRMRKECPEIGWGDFRVLPTGNRGVLTVRYEWRNNAVVAVHNLEGEPAEIRLRLPEDKLVNGGLDYLLKRREY